jgi:hypothetical protein
MSGDNSFWQPPADFDPAFYVSGQPPEPNAEARKAANRAAGELIQFPGQAPPEPIPKVPGGVEIPTGPGSKHKRPVRYKPPGTVSLVQIPGDTAALIRAAKLRELAPVIRAGFGLDPEPGDPRVLNYNPAAAARLGHGQLRRRDRAAETVLAELEHICPGCLHKIPERRLWALKAGRVPVCRSCRRLGCSARNTSELELWREHMEYPADRPAPRLTIGQWQARRRYEWLTRFCGNPPVCPGCGVKHRLGGRYSTRLRYAPIGRRWVSQPGRFLPVCSGCWKAPEHRIPFDPRKHSE